MLSQVSRIAARSVARASVRATMLHTPRACFSNISTLKAIVPETVKALNTEIADFEADIDNCAEELKTYGAVAAVNEEGDITLEFKGDAFDVLVKFNREFEYDDDADQEDLEYYGNSDREQESEQEDAEQTAYHTLEVTLKGKKSTIVLNGTLSLKGDFQVDTITPINAEGVKSRRISTTDLSEEALESVFDVLEQGGINQEFSDFLVKYARYHRLNAHVESVEQLISFIKQL